MLKLKEKIILVFLGVYIIIQIIVPFRYLLYPGNPCWHELSHKFIWHMKLSHKQAYSRFIASSPSLNKQQLIDPIFFLTEWQYESMVCNPQMLLQFAHYLAKLYQDNGVKDIEIRVDAKESLNCRKLQELIDPRVDLSKEEKSWHYYNWIMPLNPKS